MYIFVQDILSQQHIEAEDIISNLKLQKLIYYSQGFALALSEKPLFAESIQAWEHGPVVPELYYEYKVYKGGAIPPPSKEVIKDIKKKLNIEQKEIINEVCDVYGQFSAWKLRNLSHEDQPWINHYNKADITIHQEEMKAYFKTLVVQNGEN